MASTGLATFAVSEARKNSDGGRMVDERQRKEEKEEEE